VPPPRSQLASIGCPDRQLEASESRLTLGREFPRARFFPLLPRRSSCFACNFSEIKRVREICVGKKNLFPWRNAGVEWNSDELQLFALSMDARGRDGAAVILKIGPFRARNDCVVFPAIVFSHILCTALQSALRSQRDCYFERGHLIATTSQSRCACRLATRVVSAFLNFTNSLLRDLAACIDRRYDSIRR